MILCPRGGEEYSTKFCLGRVHLLTLLCAILTEKVALSSTYLRTFARNFSNIDFSLKILPLKDDELVMSEM